jgi:acetylglutamate kinase
MIADGQIAGGMIPKTETALAAIEKGVRAVVILDGRVPNACLLELFTEHGAGSLIRKTEPRVMPRGLRQVDPDL